MAENIIELNVILNSKRTMGFSVSNSRLFHAVSGIDLEISLDKQKKPPYTFIYQKQYLTNTTFDVAIADIKIKPCNLNVLLVKVGDACPHRLIEKRNAQEKPKC